MQAPLPWELSKCVSLARVLQRMAYLLKQQPLHNSPVQQVSIISNVMFHLLSDNFMQIAISRASSGVSCSRHVCKYCAGTQLSHEEVAGIRAKSVGNCTNTMQ